MTARRTALLKPFQLLGIAAGLAVFVGVIVLVTIRRLEVALIGAGAVFVIATVVLAMLVLSYQPNPDVAVYLDRHEAKQLGDPTAIRAEGEPGPERRAAEPGDGDAV